MCCKRLCHVVHVIVPRSERSVALLLCSPKDSPVHNPTIPHLFFNPTAILPVSLSNTLHYVSPMPPKRPPPLPRNLFVADGPLGPGSAPLPPSPMSVHPSFIIDAHSFVDHTKPVTSPDLIFAGLSPGSPRPPVKSAVQVKLDVSAEPAQAVLGVKPFSIHPTILNLILSMPPSITNIAKGSVDIIVPCTLPLVESEWDLVDEAVMALDESYASTSGAGGAAQEKLVICRDYVVPAVLIVGLWLGYIFSNNSANAALFSRPPSPSPHLAPDPLLHSDAYNLHLARLAQLSLHANVYLKALPPVVDLTQGNKWWEDRSELEQVLRMYVAPAIETFGTHRIIFGSFPALPLAELVRARQEDMPLDQPISNEEWYAVLRKVVSELGEDAEAMTEIMGGNGAKVYELH
ncbi:hypothetical protein EHS25_001478 [Saitozyma podzolica]|uniref:Uncharacterized protein n=1 Tax=Saitozyma podzolica TaxID=1890683 RepID=A0A427YGS9_9TREE|nr:hypothetical protein EHS25_001478 [Saitozyma podzolica]